MVVFIQDIQGNALMPTRRFGKVRRMLKSGNAVVVCLEPFTIRLCYETTGYIQPCTLGIDPGAKHVGISVTTEKKELLKVQVDLRTDIKKRLDDKREYRNMRRYLLRYRQARFNNRVSTKKEGWIPPSLMSRNSAHLRILKFISKIVPFNCIRFEYCPFDTRKMRNPDVQGSDYQHSEKEDFDNTKSFVKHRDSFKCQVCHGKSGDTRLEVHHLTPVSKGGSNHPDNLATVCHKCHTEIHQDKVKLKITKKALQKKNVKLLRDAAVMNVIKDILVKMIRQEFPDREFHITYGYKTARLRREHNIDKSHCSDAYVIARNLEAEPTDTMYYGRVFRRHNRQKFKANRIKHGILKKSKTEYKLFGFCLWDRILYDNQRCFIGGRRDSGYFKITSLEGKLIKDGVNYSRLKYKSHSKGLTFEKVRYDKN